MTDDSPYSIRLPADLRADLDREAKLESRPVSYLIVQAMRQWIEWRKAQRKQA
jgi:predicted transcriptional regulator